MPPPGRASRSCRPDPDAASPRRPSRRRSSAAGSGEPPAGTCQRSSTWPVDSTASSNTPPGTVGPWLTESTRIAATLLSRWLQLRHEGVPPEHADRYAVCSAWLRDADDGASVHRARAAAGADVRSWASVRARVAGDAPSGECVEHAGAEPQKSVGATGGGSRPPLVATLASSRRPRRIAALRGAKSSRLLLKSA